MGARPDPICHCVALRLVLETDAAEGLALGSGWVELGRADPRGSARKNETQLYGVIRRKSGGLAGQ